VLCLKVDSSTCGVLLVADGISECPLTVTVALQSGAQTFPQPGANLNVEVTEVTEVSSSAGIDGEEPQENKEVLSSQTGDGALLQQRVGLTTDADGQATLYIHSPSLFLEQTFVISVTGQDVSGADLVPPEDTIVTIDEFENRTEVALLADATSILSASTTTLHISALDQLGFPANGTEENPATVTIKTDEPLSTLTWGAESGDELTVTMVEGVADVVLPLQNSCQPTTLAL